MQMTSSRDDKQAEGQQDEPVAVPLTSLQSVTAFELSKVHEEQGNQRIDRNMQKRENVMEYMISRIKSNKKNKIKKRLKPMFKFIKLIM